MKRSLYWSATRMIRTAAARVATTRRSSSTTTTAASRGKQWVEKISARVFCPEDEGVGGNPVTIFATMPSDGDEERDEDFYYSRELSPKTQQELAQTCEWESVMVSHTTSQQQQPTLSFFMPTGQEVSFCAHAAMAGSIRAADDLEQVTPLHFNMSSNDENNPKQSASAIVHKDDCVTLKMPKITFSQYPVENPSLLYRLLRTHCSLAADHLQSPDRNTPQFVHADVAGGRPKTLVYVNDIETLNEVCQAPTDAAGFTRALNLLSEDETTNLHTTTGLYLYTKHPDLDATYVCRQFPIASGYAEDPATGIAAAALAAALDTDLPFVKFEQGQAMGQPSLILVEDFTFHWDQQQQPLEKEGQSEASTSHVEDGDNAIAKSDEGGVLESDSAKADERRQRIAEAELETKYKSVPVSYKLLGKIEIDDREEIEIDL